MTIEGRLGRILFALAFVALGLESLALRIYVMRLETVPAAWPGHTAGALASGAFVLAAGAAILLDRTARIAASTLAALLLLWTVVLHVPDLAVNPTLALTGIFEPFALFAAAWTLAALMPPAGGAWDRFAALGRTWGPIGFGVSLIVFGVVHFLFHDFVASFIPAWIPFRLFFAYATGVGHAAAGLAILTRIVPRLAATLAGAMYASWVVLLHIPRTLAAIHDPFEWNGIFVAAALSGGAFLVAASFARKT
jgi:uncharacterized membrane protein